MSVSANDNAAKVSVRGFLAKYSVLLAFAAIVLFFAVASSSSPYSRSSLSWIISICNKPRKPARKPNPSAVDDSGS